MWCRYVRVGDECGGVLSLVSVCMGVCVCVSELVLSVVLVCMGGG